MFHNVFTLTAALVIYTTANAAVITNVSQGSTNHFGVTVNYDGIGDSSASGSQDWTATIGGTSASGEHKLDELFLSFSNIGNSTAIRSVTVNTAGWFVASPVSLETSQTLQLKASPGFELINNGISFLRYSLELTAAQNGTALPAEEVSPILDRATFGLGIDGATHIITLTNEAKNGFSVGGITAVPEPLSCALIGGILATGLLMKKKM